MTDRTALLQYAEAVVDGRVALGSRGPRTAAVLARLAFEDWLDERSRSWMSADARPSTNSKLVVLGTQHGADLGEHAKRVWHALSRACHYHAYELQPSAAEVARLITEVRTLNSDRG